MDPAARAAALDDLAASLRERLIAEAGEGGGALPRPLPAPGDPAAARLCDAGRRAGWGVTVVTPPLSLDGPVLTIRRFRPRGFSDDDLVALGTWSVPLRTFLAKAVRARLNILVTGGTGSGKTTTLN